ncbi:unnamed protein product [Caenorhabditis bovis]|uniref:Uncharacterized protein n=1 Tax=Caenorhabditis bovis TaxID=2654633 RepID=A0A8S1E9I1_9PELO|nr:unnamed protein product [Caenorhabditis bovis]
MVVYDSSVGVPPLPLNRRKTEPKRKTVRLHTTDDGGQAMRDRAFSMYTVSSDILRVSGYTQQFRSLLTARFTPRRESVPNVSIDRENEKLTDAPHRESSSSQRHTALDVVGAVDVERRRRRRQTTSAAFNVDAELERADGVVAIRSPTIQHHRWADCAAQNEHHQIQRSKADYPHIQQPV